MRKLLILASAVAMTVPAITMTVAPTEALASAADCRTAATVGGGVGGALIGGGLAHGGAAGALLGGLGGAVIGHEVARNNCKDKPHRYAVACRYETHYPDHRPYQVRLCAGRDGVWAARIRTSKENCDD
ncbi:MAG: hypothetical protein WDN45_07695 [Caulobacteraceae bacterium]